MDGGGEAGVRRQRGVGGWREEKLKRFKEKEEQADQAGRRGLEQL